MPINEPNRNKWIQAIEEFQPFDYIVQTYHICSLHFSKDDIIIKGKKKTIIPGKVPSVFTHELNNNNDSNLNTADTNGSHIFILHPSGAVCVPTYERITTPAVEVATEIADENELDVFTINCNSANHESDESIVINNYSFDLIDETTINISNHELLDANAPYSSEILDG